LAFRPKGFVIRQIRLFIPEKDDLHYKISRNNKSDDPVAIFFTCSIDLKE